MTKRLALWSAGVAAGLSLLLAAGSSGVLAATAEQEPTVVATDKGDVEGVIEDGVRAFKGIPFALPPTGEFRWAMPQPAKPWGKKGEVPKLPGLAYGSACPQPQRYGIPEYSNNEDCLTINVSTPATKAENGAKRPVFVWIHGGGFVGGSSALYKLDAFVKAGDMVVVSFNYRVGVFGFMAHPGFDEESNGGYGLEDQRAALRWVQKNIAAFGGDPDNMTLAGESAGGAGACMHILAPEQSKGLFHKAIIQSAGCVEPLHTVEQANKIGENIAKAVGCDGQPDVAACLRKAGVESLLAEGAKAINEEIMSFSPVVGSKKSLPQQGLDAMRKGEFVKVPMINGGNLDELRLYVAYEFNDQNKNRITQDAFEDRIATIYGKDRKPAILNEYAKTQFPALESKLGTIWTDYHPTFGLNYCTYLKTAELAKAKGVTVYQYEFADRTAPAVTADPGYEMGAVHSAELPYQFPGFDNTQAMKGGALTDEQTKIAKLMMDYWISFAKTGTPQAKDSPVAWEPFADPGKVLTFANGTTSFANSREIHRCAFWEQQYPAQLKD